MWQNALPANITKWVFTWNKSWRNHKFAWNWWLVYSKLTWNSHVSIHPSHPSPGCLLSQVFLRRYIVTEVMIVSIREGSFTMGSFYMLGPLYFCNLISNAFSLRSVHLLDISYDILTFWCMVDGTYIEPCKNRSWLRISILGIYLCC